MSRILTTLAMVALLAASLVGSVSAQSIPKPSVPEFTLQLLIDSYDIPDSTSTNPYNGSTIIHLGSHYENKTLELSIKNQLHNKEYAFIYDIRVKGHFEEEWTSKSYIMPYEGDFPDSFSADTWGMGFRPLFASDSDYTIVSYNVNSYPSNTELDYKVQAFIFKVTPPPTGTKYQSTTYDLIAKSDWSDIQTISLQTNVQLSPTPVPPSSTSSSVSQNPTVIPTQTGNNVAVSQSGWVEVVAVVALGLVAVLVVVVVVLGRRIRRLEHKLN